ncbi:iron ABC transporter permease [Acetobacteraceae bacterium ESL0709]|nr:iron ABC transporter permease [Acetobacteraceae bacterium ESL0697]MDF7678878.1 iron ABC transporter permease [Acetobacteraceae bacterium ESL0709]
MISRPSPFMVILTLGILLVISALFVCTLGATGFTLGKTGSLSLFVIEQIRLPRISLAIITGAALGISGAVMQGLFRNPLADPGLIGVSSGAALGTTVYIVLGSSLGLDTLSRHYPFLHNVMLRWMVPLSGMIGGFCTTGLLYSFARRQEGLSTTLIILTGIAIGSFTAAITGILTFRADDTALRDITFWSLGSLAGANWSGFVILLPFFLTALILIFPLRDILNAFLLGEKDAILLGHPVERFKKMAILGVALATGPVVSFVGVIGFIGVVVPHLVRLVTGPDHRIVLPASALTGALLLLWADTAARLIAPPAEIPVGIITAALGAPAFLWLLTRTQTGSALS